MRLYNYWRSSTSFRVRIALNLKKLEFEYAACHLRKDEHRGEDYLALNAQGLVPTLELDDGRLISQSLAIIDYLDEVYPDPPLLPLDPFARSRVRSLAQAVSLDIHPVVNLRVLEFISGELHHSEETVAYWFRHWTTETFAALETRLAGEAETGRFCHGQRPTLADICLVPQVLSGARFDVDMTAYPTISRIYDACMQLDAFAKAAPALQPDAEQPPP